MRICIPTTTKEGKEARVYEHFGSAPFFTIYDTENGVVEVVDNSNQQHEHGMCNPMGALEGKRIEAVVTGGMGAGAVRKMNAGGIKVFRAIPGIVMDVAKQFIQGGLEEITVNNACAHHGGCH